jgi:hypothetical protein
MNFNPFDEANRIAAGSEIELEEHLRPGWERPIRPVGALGSVADSGPSTRRSEGGADDSSDEGDNEDEEVDEVLPQEVWEAIFDIAIP